MEGKSFRCMKLGADELRIEWLAGWVGGGGGGGMAPIITVRIIR